MAITYSWRVDHMDTKMSQNGLDKVVVSCRWSITATDDSTPPVTANDFGYATFSSPDANTFTAYDDLTEETVLGWIWASSSPSGDYRGDIEAGLAAQIDQVKNPPTVILANPWNSAPAE